MNTFISNSAFLVIRSRGIAQQYDVQYQVFLLMWYRMIDTVLVFQGINERCCLV